MLSLTNKTVLAIAPHVDDVELGVGATIHSLSRNNTVYYVALSLPPLVKKEEFMNEFRNSFKSICFDIGTECL